MIIIENININSYTTKQDYIIILDNYPIVLIINKSINYLKKILFATKHQTISHTYIGHYFLLHCNICFYLLLSA